MAQSEFNIAQEDSFEKVRVKFEEQRKAGVDAEVAQRSFDSVVRRATVWDQLSVEQLAEGADLPVADVSAALARLDGRSAAGDGGFGKRFAEVYPGKAAEAERQQAIKIARKAGFLQSLGMDKRDPRSDE